MGYLSIYRVATVQRWCMILQPSTVVIIAVTTLPILTTIGYIILYVHCICTLYMYIIYIYTLYMYIIYVHYICTLYMYCIPMFNVYRSVSKGNVYSYDRFGGF